MTRGRTRRARELLADHDRVQALERQVGEYRKRVRETFEGLEVRVPAGDPDDISPLRELAGRRARVSHAFWDPDRGVSLSLSVYRLDGRGFLQGKIGSSVPLRRVLPDLTPSLLSEPE